MTGPATAGPLLELPADLATLGGLPSGGVPVAHRIGSPPGLQPVFLALLAERAPEAWVRPLLVQSDPHEGRSAVGRHHDPAAAIRGTDAVPGYVGVYNLEHFAEFLGLARALESELRTFVGDAEGGLGRVNLAAFVSPPGSVVPAHPDMHHNVLCQIAGSKTVWIEDEPVRRRHDARVAAYYDCPAAPTAVLPDARRHVLMPGDGVYVPADGFHWVEVGDEPSVTLSIGFDTARTRDVVDARRLAGALRRRHVPVRVAAYPGRASTARSARVVRRLRSRA